MSLSCSFPLALALGCASPLALGGLALPGYVEVALPDCSSINAELTRRSQEIREQNQRVVEERYQRAREEGHSVDDEGRIVNAEGVIIDYFSGIPPQVTDATLEGCSSNAVG